MAMFSNLKTCNLFSFLLLSVNMSIRHFPIYVDYKQGSLLHSFWSSIDNCHVLEGSTVLDQSSGRDAGKVLMLGGFIGFGDSDAVPTKLTVKNSTAKVTVDSQDWAQVNSCFIAALGYAAQVLLENCDVEGEVKGGANLQNYAGGLIARAQNAGVTGYEAKANIVIKKCTFKGNVIGRAGVGGLVGAIENSGTLTIQDSHASGTVTNIQNNIGGIIGLSSHGVVKVEGCTFDGKLDGQSYVGGICGGLGTNLTSIEITRCTSKGQVISSHSYSGGIVGAAQAPVQVINNCASLASVELTGKSAQGKQIGGIVGTATSKIEITNSFAAGDLKTITVAGGVIGRVAGADSKVSKCIAWNASLSATTSSLLGAVIGSLEKSGEYASCVRRSDMAVTNSSSALADQDDITGLAATTAYHGKAAAADKTASAVAKELGWDETIWDLSKDVPALK